MGISALSHTVDHQAALSKDQAQGVSDMCVLHVKVAASVVTPSPRNDWVVVRTQISKAST